MELQIIWILHRIRYFSFIFNTNWWVYQVQKNICKKCHFEKTIFGYKRRKTCFTSQLMLIKFFLHYYILLCLLCKYISYKGSSILIMISIFTDMNESGKFAWGNYPIMKICLISTNIKYLLLYLVVYPRIDIRIFVKVKKQHFHV